MTTEFNPKGLLAESRATKRLSELRQIIFAILDSDLTVAYASANFQLVLSEPTEPVVGQLITNLIIEMLGLEESLQAVLEGRQAEVRLEQVNRPQAAGHLLYLNFQIVPLQPAQPNQGLLLMAEDVTERSELEQHLTQRRNELHIAQVKLAQANAELQRLNRIKSFFLSMAAHDMRAPLTTIAGYAELLLDSFKSNPQTDPYAPLHAIQRQAYRLSRLISSVLNVDQIEQGQLHLNLSHCDLNELVSEVCEMLQVNAQSNQITLHPDLPTPALNITADLEKIRQILYNLVGNAIKYSGPLAKVDIRVKQSESEAIIQVQDTGHGMTTEELGNLFQPYYRTSEARSGKTAGTGLGLYITKTLVEAHHGRIEVVSQSAIGTTFTIYLPQRSPLN